MNIKQCIRRYKQTNVEFDATLDKACEGKRSIFIGKSFNVNM